MREVIPDRLWQGNFSEARDIRAVLDLGVQAVIDLAANEAPLSFPRDIVMLRYPLIDGAGNPQWLLVAALDGLQHLVEQNVPTFVYCSAGMSRSPALVIAALSRVHNKTVETIVEEFFSNEALDIAPGLWNDLISCL